MMFQSDMTKEKAIEWLKNIGLSTSGNKRELIIRINKFKRYPKLVAKLQGRAKRYYTFPCSLNPLSIPPPNASWKDEINMYPKVSNEIFKHYASQNLEGSQGQQEKAFRMLQSRKIKMVKVISDIENSDIIYVKASIKQSYGAQSRPAVIQFFEKIPKKGHCNCPVGASGLCCHILALLLYLKHFKETGEKILELTCTEQIQKWHRRTGKGSIPMMPLKRIKPKSAKRKDKKKLSISVADPYSSYFKRNVTKIIEDLNKKLDEGKSVTEHVYKVLSASAVGRKSSVGEHLCHKFKLNELGDHQYISKLKFEEYVLGINPEKEKQINSYINVSEDLPQAIITTEELISTDAFPIHIEKATIVYDINDKNYVQTSQNIAKQVKKEDKNEIELDICFTEAPKPHGTNYVDNVQNTNEWQQTRRKKITGSWLSALLGMYGQKQFKFMWSVVRDGVREKDLSNIENIRRGHIYEKEALAHFEKISKTKTNLCGFFKHPYLNHFGSSPDALGPDGILIEIKTRAQNSSGPLESLFSYPNYYIQCQLQLACTDAHSCILVSYHPESKSANFFLIYRNDALFNIIADVCNSILNDTQIAEWIHGETTYADIGDKLIRKCLDFDSLKPFRSYIKSCTKDIKKVRFIDEIEFQID